MAIARDVITNGSFPSGSATSTWNHTITGSAPILFVVYYLNNNAAGGGPTDITYNGVAMTKAIEQADFAANKSVIWYLQNPPTGTHAVLVTFSGTVTPNGNGNNIFSISYTGAAGVGQPDATAGNSNLTGNSVTASITTVASQTWILGMTADPNGDSVANYSWTGLTSLAGTAGKFFGDSNGNVAPGSHSITATDTFQTDDHPLALLSFSALVPDNPVVSDSTAVSDTPTIEKINTLKVTDSTALSESVAMATVNFGLTGMLASLVSTSYKWLTSTLLSAQQQFAVHPYTKAQIIDDTVQPNAVFFPTGGGAQPTGNGTLLRAPDGSLIAAGFDASNHISFWKATDMNAAAGVWPTQVVLDTDSFVLNSQNRVSMAVSEMVNGSYRIDVSYFNNFVNSASNINLINQFSDDGGVTWTKVTVIAPISMASSLYSANTFNLCLATMKPYLNSAGQMVSGWLYIKQSGSVFGTNFTKGYVMTYVTRTGSTVSAETNWSSKNVDSGDWTLNGMDTYTVNGTVHVIFSGFRNIVDTPNAALAATDTNGGNYGLWHTSINTITNNKSSDLWKYPTKLFISLANTSNNLNSFTYPVTNVDAAGQISCLFRATVTRSVAVTAQGSTSQIVTPHTNFMMMLSQDGENFTYPTPVVDANGNELEVFQNPPGDSWVSYAQQGQYYYIGGETMLWQFIQNSTVADVSQDLISTVLSEAAGQPSSIQLTIANSNNKWVGSSPTGSGASAIAKNRKIVLNPGYYNASANPETGPRNVYFIDDIQQSVTSNTNNVTIAGRDLYKKLLVTITKFAFGWFGPYFYSDTFDGSTFQNWNQAFGTWNETTNPGFMTGSSDTGDAVITLAGLNSVIPFSSSYVVTLGRPIAGKAYIFPLYIDANNWLRLTVDDNANTYFIDQNVASSTTNLASGSFSIASGFAPLLVKQYEYYKFQFMAGGPTFGDPNALADWTIPVHLGSEIDLTSVFVGPNPSFRFPWTVGFGCSGTTGVFGFFKYVQYMPPNALYDIIKSLATKAGVFSYVFQNLFKDYFFTPSNYTGTFTSPNRNLVITATNQAVNNVVAHNIADGELKFVAKVASSSATYGFSTIFRSSGGNQYMFNVAQVSGGIQCRFQFLFGGTTYVFPNSVYDAPTGGTFFTNSLSIDITQNHTYRIVMVGGWMYAFIDDTMVAAWNDNNTDTNYLTTGTWGWIASANTTLTVNHVESSAFWKQIPTFSLNPGDDVSDAIHSLIQTLRAWFFSDLMGRFKAIFLSSSDTSTYTYNNQLSVQAVDKSDKEYISQVTVYGNNGIQATATDTTLMAGASIREEVIVDYAISTQAEAQARANNELTNANQYQNQYNPKQTLNIGSEIFDAVTVINTGSNSSGVNSPTRTYGQVIGIGGQDSEYTTEIQTGNL